MYVTYAGWTQADGVFHHEIYFDKSKQDYAIHYDNGKVARQVSEWQHHTADWNNDGDVYTLFGAKFQFFAPDGSSMGCDFLTPEDLVRMAADAKDVEASSYGPRVTKVDGIEIPDRQRRSSLDQRLQQTEARAMHQEAERNRKMAALGIRHPDEPWAR